jgi:NTP pyrophosphatase (non-canonical NTP hydrolase)
MKLDEIAHQCTQDAADWFPDLFDKSTDRLINHHLLGLGGEIGEVLNKWKKYDRGSMSREEMRQALKDELADVFIYLMNLPLLLGFDMEQEYNVKREFNKQRFGTARSDAGSRPRDGQRRISPLGSGSVSSPIVNVDVPSDWKGSE